MIATNNKKFGAYVIQIPINDKYSLHINYEIFELYMKETTHLLDEDGEITQTSTRFFYFEKPIRED